MFLDPENQTCKLLNFTNCATRAFLKRRKISLKGHGAKINLVLTQKNCLFGSAGWSVSDMVVNQEDFLATRLIHLLYCTIFFHVSSNCCMHAHMSHVLKKTCLQDFWPGPTQTGLYSHRRWLWAWNFRI